MYIFNILNAFQQIRITNHINRISTVFVYFGEKVLNSSIIGIKFLDGI